MLHVIHDFLPRHRAGSEIYAFELARAQLAHHDVTVLCAEYDPAREHGHVVWRVHDGVAVVELVNNWRCDSFEETYRPPLITERIRHVLRTLRPDVVHVHNLLNLSFDLPACARELGIPVVATLHDYTLVCPSGGQRLHRRERHVCHDIEPDRCARCFAESPFAAQAALGQVARIGPAAALVGRAAAAVRRRFPVLVDRAAVAARQLNTMPIGAPEIEARLRAARQVFQDVDLFVAPSASLANDFKRFGLPPARIRVSDYGMAPLTKPERRAASLPLRIGFVGTVAWHKGVHVLIDAVRQLPAGSCRVLVFGETDTFPDYTRELRASAAGLPVGFVGGFDAEDTAVVYAQIDVLVVASIWPENSPLVIHEAYMAGVPVVGSRTGGIPELITDEVNGCLFETGSASDLARALRSFVDRPERVSEFAAAAPAIKTFAENVAEWDGIYKTIDRAEATPA